MDFFAPILPITHAVIRRVPQLAGRYPTLDARALVHVATCIHEGIGEIWFEALKSPRRHARFVLIEERAEGGDQLFRMAAEDPSFLSGFTRTCEGGGVALYVRNASSD